MVRTQIQLSEEQTRKIKQLAAAQSVSMAAVIRQAIDALLASTDKPDLAETRARAAAVAGRFRTNIPDLATRHDDYLNDSFEDLG